MSIGAKITKENKDIATNDPTQLYFHSQWRMFRIVKEGVVYLTIPSGTTAVQTKDINHEQKFIPFALVYAESNGRGGLMPTMALSSASGTRLSLYYGVNNTFLRISARSQSNLASAHEVRFRYFIFAQPCT